MDLNVKLELDDSEIKTIIDVWRRDLTDPWSKSDNDVLQIVINTLMEEEYSNCENTWEED